MKASILAIIVVLSGGLLLRAQTNTLNSSGNAGIGTTSPAAPLHVVGPFVPGYMQVTVQASGTDNRSGISFLNSSGGRLGILYLESGGDFILGRDQAGMIRFFSGGTEKLRIAADGKVGIGAPHPSYQLDVQHTANDVVVRAATTTAGAWFMADSATDGYHGLRLFTAGVAKWFLGSYGSSDFTVKRGDATGAELMRITTGGKLGVGTSSPTSKLTVVAAGSGDGLTVREDGTYGVTSFYLTNGSGNGASRNWLLATNFDANGALSFRRGNVAGADPYHAGSTSMILTSAGDVGIGTTAPTHKLSVNGTIKTKEVIVETAGWSDYVFADNYALKPLAEIEAHIKEHKHLPGIPSAKEVAEQGVSVGEMQARLLAKIEEITLHQIAQQKEIAVLRAENRDLRARLDQALR